MSRGPNPCSARIRAACCVAALLALLTSCGESEHPLRRVARGEAQVSGRGMLVIAIDGLRYDRTSLARTDRDTTPCLRRLAEQGAEVTDTWSTMPERFDAHVSLLTGVDPLVGRRPALRELGARRTQEALPIVVPRDAPSLAIEFLAAGWTTAAFVDHDDLARIRGLDRGFRHFVEAGGRGATERTGFGVFGVGARFIQWLNTRELDEDWFAYQHMGDLERIFGREKLPVPAHWIVAPGPARRVPVAQHEPAIGGLPRSRVGSLSANLSELELQYDAGLFALDNSLERILRHVDEFSRRELITVVVVGTYGLPFGESGLYLAPGLPDAPDLRVPWVIRPSRAVGVPAATRIEGIASLLDVMPTLLELAAIPVRSDLHGFSRAAELCGRSEVNPRRQHFARTLLGAGASIVTDDEHWSVLAPALAPVGFTEGWTGRPADEPAARVRALALRRGPSASDSLDLRHPTVTDAARWDLYAELWERWNGATREVRDTLHFEAGRGNEELAARLRELQRASL
jgi:hypothetical protein